MNVYECLVAVIALFAVESVVKSGFVAVKDWQHQKTERAKYKNNSNDDLRNVFETSYRRHGDDFIEN